MLSQKFKLFITPFCEATPACLLVMVQGNIWLATMGHLQKALETGFLTGLGVFIFSLFSHRWFNNKYIVAAITGAIVFVADLIVHPSHFGGFATEAIITGIFTAIISLALNIAGKKLFLHAKDRISID
jgi:hypothetical protein